MSTIDRRQVIGGAAGMASVLAGARLAPIAKANAQESTPVSTSDTPAFLFVQSSFTSGVLDQATEGVQSWLLQLEGAPDHTLFFSDRPDRIVGAVSTQDFVNEFDFSTDNPPNAALVLHVDDSTEVVFLELTEPRHDPESGQLTYIVTILEDGSLEESLYGVSGEVHTLETYPSEFGSASLFIDSGCNPITDPRC